MKKTELLLHATVAVMTGMYAAAKIRWAKEDEIWCESHDDMDVYTPQKFRWDQEVKNCCEQE